MRWVKNVVECYIDFQMSQECFENAKLKKI